MPVRLTAHMPDGPALTRWLGNAESCLIGRASDCDWVLPHPSVSRRQARIEPAADGWRLCNESRKNPTQIDGCAVDAAPLADQHWLRFGDVPCEFQRCSERTWQDAQTRRRQREAQSTALGDRIAALPDRCGVLREVVAAVTQLAECERGLLLLRDGNDWRVAEVYPAGEAAIALPASSAALARAAAEGRPVAVNDVLCDAQLATRPSLVSGGIRALLALPLRTGERVDAVLYADRRALGQPLTDFDLELAAAFAERAALWIAAQRAVIGLADLPRWDAAAAAAA